MANDSLNSHDDNRRELYERFREELRTDRRSMFFDEDDLIELYDYANDRRDRFTALEVLFCGERLYPSSTALAERRALFYLNLDDEAAAEAVELLPDDSMIKRLTALRVSHADTETARKELDTLLSTRSAFSDEEIIQLSDTAEELGLYDWLLANRSKIAAHTDYPPTFLYELCQIAQSRDPEEALRILEDLTMMEPFSIDFWLLTGQIQLETGNAEKALPALEYALAIDPENVRGLMMKAQAFNELQYPADQIEAVLRDVMTIDPDVGPAYLAMAMLYAQSGKAEEGMKLLRVYNSLHPGNPQTLDVMLMVADRLPHEDVPEIAQFLSPAMRDYIENFIDMARRHADDGRHRAAALLLIALDKAYKLGADFDLMMEELYRAGMYHEAVQSYQAHFTNQHSVVQIIIDELNDCFAAFWFILAAIRAGITDGLAPIVAALLSSEPVNSSNRSIDEILESRGLAGYLSKINEYLSGNKSLTPDDLDPFVKDKSTTKQEPSSPE